MRPGVRGKTRVLTKSPHLLTSVRIYIEAFESSSLRAQAPTSLHTLPTFQHSDTSHGASSNRKKPASPDRWGMASVKQNPGPATPGDDTGRLHIASGECEGEEV
jgi:hypothetical protein